MKNEASLTDNFYGLAGVYHQYEFKYEKLRKYHQLFKHYLTKEKQEVEKSKLLAADLLKCLYFKMDLA